MEQEARAIYGRWSVCSAHRARYSEPVRAKEQKRVRCNKKVRQKQFVLPLLHRRATYSTVFTFASNKKVKIQVEIELER